MSIKIPCSQFCNQWSDSDDPAWLQATLPIKSGSLCLQCAIELGLSTFLASHVTKELFNGILPLDVSLLPSSLLFEEALSLWLVVHKTILSWMYWRSTADVLECCRGKTCHARLLVSATKESGTSVATHHAFFLASEWMIPA